MYGGSITVVGAPTAFEIQYSDLTNSTLSFHSANFTVRGGANSASCISFLSTIVTASTVEFIGGSLVFSGAMPTQIWNVQGTETVVTDTSFVLSRCDAQLSGGTSVRALYLTGNANISSGTTIYWHYSSYALRGLSNSSHQRTDAMGPPALTSPSASMIPAPR